MPRGNVAPISRRIAETLERARLDLGMNQSEVGDRAGVSQSQVSKYLRGVRSPNIDVLDALCRALNLDVADVVAAAVADRR